VESLAFVIFDAIFSFLRVLNWYLGVWMLGDLFLECVAYIESCIMDSMEVMDVLL